MDGNKCEAEWKHGSFVQMLDLVETRKSSRKPVSANKAGGETCDNVPLFALNYEMNFVYKFEVDDQNRPILHYDQPGLDLSDGNYALLKSNFPTNEETVGVIEKFANSQKEWAENFLEAWEKMQLAGGENLVEDPTKLAFLGYSFLDQGKDFKI